MLALLLPDRWCSVAVGVDVPESLVLANNLLRYRYRYAGRRIGVASKAAGLSKF